MSLQCVSVVVLDYNRQVVAAIILALEGMEEPKALVSDVLGRLRDSSTECQANLESHPAQVNCMRVVVDTV
jgi:hypothetical protein